MPLVSKPKRGVGLAGFFRLDGSLGMLTIVNGLFLYQPILYRVFFGIDVNAYLDDRQIAEGKLGGVIFKVYLLHGCLGGFVELELEVG